MRIERVSIPKSAQPIISTSSKGDQSKWRIGDKWVKQNAAMRVMQKYWRLLYLAAPVCLSTATFNTFLVKLNYLMVK
ncbi:hypothetical protein [Lysinibacillus sphaericus]|uniref:hypothetical protein n=1 Tax=Lysinibacillus sphaericus TaxID=1421 RepID=UPI003D725F32